jgi:hypothetical protein
LNKWWVRKNMEEEKKGEKKMGEAIFLTHQNLQ